MASFGRRHSSRSQPEDRVQALEAQLLKVQQERNDLLNDVEALCISGDPGSIFDRSNLLGQRLQDAYKEVALARGQTKEATEQAANVQDDLEAVRASKLVVVREAREARAQAAELQKEVAFYQTQSASAMADRDAASWQAEEHRSRAASLQSDLHASEVSGQQASEEAATARAKLKRTAAQVTELMKQVQGLKIIPGLEQQLASTRQDQSQLQQQVSELKDELQVTNQHLEDARRELDQTTSDRADLAAKLSSAGDQAAAHASDATQLRHQLQTAQAKGDTAQAQLDERDAECKELRRQAGVQVSALADSRKALETATQQKVSALMSLSNAQASQRRTDERRREGSPSLQCRDPGVKGGEDSPETANALTAASSPAKTPWRGWLSRAPSGSIGPSEFPDNGVSNDVRALRHQLSEAKERAAAADALAESASHLRAALLAIASAASSGCSDEDIRTRVDELCERVVTLRIGAVLGLNSSGPEKVSPDEEGDMFSALSEGVSRQAAAAASPLSRELLDVLQVAVEALRALCSSARQQTLRLASQKSIDAAVTTRASTSVFV